jgi:hypothetical protein
MAESNKNELTKKEKTALIILIILAFVVESFAVGYVFGHELGYAAGYNQGKKYEQGKAKVSKPAPAKVELMKSAAVQSTALVGQMAKEWAMATALPHFVISEELFSYDEFMISYEKYDGYGHYLGTEARFHCRFTNGKIADAILSHPDNDVGKIYLYLDKNYKVESLGIYISDKYEFDPDCSEEKNSFLCEDEQKEADKWLKTLEAETRVKELVADLGNVKQHLWFYEIAPTKLEIDVDNGPEPGINLTINARSLDTDDDVRNYVASFRYYQNDVFPFESHLEVKNDLGYNTEFNLDKKGKLVSISYVLDNTYVCKKKDAVCQRAQKTVDYWRGIMKWDEKIHP